MKAVSNSNMLEKIASLVYAKEKHMSSFQKESNSSEREMIALILITGISEFMPA